MPRGGYLLMPRGVILTPRGGYLNIMVGTQTEERGGCTKMGSPNTEVYLLCVVNVTIAVISRVYTRKLSKVTKDSEVCV